MELLSVLFDTITDPMCILGSIIMFVAILYIIHLYYKAINNYSYEAERKLRKLSEFANLILVIGLVIVFMIFAMIFPWDDVNYNDIGICFCTSFFTIIIMKFILATKK